MHFHVAERKFMDDNGKLQKKTHYVRVVQFMINIYTELLCSMLTFDVQKITSCF